MLYHVAIHYGVFGSRLPPSSRAKQDMKTVSVMREAVLSRETSVAAPIIMITIIIIIVSSSSSSMIIIISIVIISSSSSSSSSSSRSSSSSSSSSSMMMIISSIIIIITIIMVMFVVISRCTGQSALLCNMCIHYSLYIYIYICTYTPT